MTRIDTCGMSCPQPVLMTKKALDKGASNLTVIVDNNTAKENVQRFLNNSGFVITIKEENDIYLIEAKK